MYDHQTAQKKRVSLLIYILSFVALIGFSTLLFFFLKRLGVKPPVNYSFKSAPFNSGYTLLNDNKESANFTVLVGKDKTPNIPSARFEVKDASVDFSLANSQGKNRPLCHCEERSDAAISRRSSLAKRPPFNRREISDTSRWIERRIHHQR